MAGRLPADYEYHVSSLQKPCLMPLVFAHEMPEIHPPGTLKTLGGTAGHKILELSMLDTLDLTAERRLELGLPPKRGRIMTDDCAALEQVWFDRLLEANKEDGNTFDEERLVAFAEENATDFCTQIINWWAWWAENGGEVVLVESLYNLELAGVSKDTKPYKVAGKIDLVFRHKDIGLVLADWKFGRMKKQNVRDQFVLSMDYQLATYSLAMFMGTCSAPDGSIITPGRPDMALLFLMDDLSPYKVKSQIKIPNYMTDAKAAWLEECRQAAMGGVADTTRELHEAWQAKQQDADAYPNNKTKQASAVTALKRLEEHKANPKLYHPAGSLRGPCAHWTEFSDAALDTHRQEMVARMGTTRMGGIVRVRSEGCSFCFWKQACLQGREQKPMDKIDWDAEIQAAKYSLDAIEENGHGEGSEG